MAARARTAGVRRDLSLAEANPFHETQSNRALRNRAQPYKHRRARRPSLFVGWWFCDGRRLRRATRRELAEAYRLWARHADIREGRA